MALSVDQCRDLMENSLEFSKRCGFKVLELEKGYGQKLYICYRQIAEIIDLHFSSYVSIGFCLKIDTT